MAHDQGETPTTTPWFTLFRHDDGDEDQPATDPNPADDTDDQHDDDGDKPSDDAPADDQPAKGKEIDWKKRSREWERRAKENKEKADKFDAVEAEKKTEAERLTDQAAAAEARAAKAMTRAVNAEIAALAAESFADPTDAVAALNAAEFIDGDDIDTDAIRDQLADLLERKPHWAKSKEPAAAPAPPKPRPDPGQGPRGGDNKVDYRNATREDFNGEMAKYGLRTRS
ncbi:hypothetical protein [Glycomyces artemisiae]|uniref:Scaffolding protein n=1 Tax=Glycomyces artemisiae TaxID=1076443 RepID=A0A2T0UF46_9ACTN|nr:hypothetical protein [Glycomyces artemisiae]PRY56447.1 hypothetical protein B0I28_10996 [Glycomyces artemisiae]